MNARLRELGRSRRGISFFTSCVMMEIARRRNRRVSFTASCRMLQYTHDRVRKEGEAMLATIKNRPTPCAASATASGQCSAGNKQQPGCRGQPGRKPGLFLQDRGSDARPHHGSSPSFLQSGLATSEPNASKRCPLSLQASPVVFPKSRPICVRSRNRSPAD